MTTLSLVAFVVGAVAFVAAVVVTWVGVVRVHRLTLEGLERRDLAKLSARIDELNTEVKSINQAVVLGRRR